MTPLDLTLRATVKFFAILGVIETAMLSLWLVAVFGAEWYEVFRERWGARRQGRSA